MKFLFLRHPEEWIQPGILGHPPNLISIYPPLGILYIAASLEQNGHNVKIVDLGAESLSKQQLEHKINSADAIGLSAYTNNYKNVAETAHEIKSIDPNIPIIIGGPHCTFLKEHSLSDIPDADISVDLEGDLVILDVVKYLLGKKKLLDVPGVSYKNNNNKIKLGKPPKILKDLDKLPFPARHLVEKYDYGNFAWGYKPRKKFTSMLTSRGCPFRCRFCSKYGNIREGYGYRERSAENVVKELQEINDTYGSVKIVDDNFLVNRKRAHKILDMLLANGTDIDILILGARVDSANLDLYKKMKKANVKFLSFGVESGSQPVLDFYKKKITKKQIENAVKMSRKMNFVTVGSFIFGAPIETKEHIDETINFICSLPFDSVIFRPLKYEVGSDLWAEAVKNGKISKDEYAVPADIRRGLGNFTIDELNYFVKKATTRFYLRPSFFFSQFLRDFLSMDKTRLNNFFRVAASYKWRNIVEQ
jgi:anaerobic magnesium-protoporphyrin IX monomethyl ester cyclase